MSGLLCVGCRCLGVCARACVWGGGGGGRSLLHVSLQGLHFVPLHGRCLRRCTLSLTAPTASCFAHPPTHKPTNIPSLWASAGARAAGQLPWRPRPRRPRQQAPGPAAGRGLWRRPRPAGARRQRARCEACKAAWSSGASAPRGALVWACTAGHSTAEHSTAGVACQLLLPCRMLALVATCSWEAEQA